MKRSRRALALTVVALLMSHAPVLAQAGKTWRVVGAARFARGELDGVSVLSTGELQLAPVTRALEGIEAEFVWDVEPAADGAAYIATGGPATVYLVQGDKVEMVHKGSEAQVLSVLPLPDGTVLAATAPRGIIFRFKPGGEATIFADLDESYIWDMRPAPGGGVYCATGPNGRLLELDGKGKPVVRLEVPQKNLMCLAAAADGVLYVGTQPDGFIYRLDAKGKATVLYDADEDEIRGIVVGPGGAVYACTAAGALEGMGMAEEAGPGMAMDEEMMMYNGNDEGANCLYRIVPGQGATRIAVAPDKQFFCLALVGGRVFAGTGPDGRVMAVEPDGTVRVVTELNAAQVTALMADEKGRLLAGTANPGGLHRIEKGRRPAGTFISEPFDAGFLSRWGRVWWQQAAGAGQGVRVRLRTGATAEPDEHWSDWSDWLEDPAGAVPEVPMGRFAQISAELTADEGAGTPSLLEVNASYRQANRRPRVLSLHVDGKSLLPAADDEDENGMMRMMMGEMGENAVGNTPVKYLEWGAADPNDDPLVFDLHYRGAGEREWKAIFEDLRDVAEFEWDTDRVPDGPYLLRLTASDRTVRDEASALADVRVGTPLLVDNRRPALLELRAQLQPDGSCKLSGTARDEHGAIARIRVSRNSEDWETVFPADGILDSPQEPFVHRTDALEPGEHVFVFAAADDSGNTGSGKVVVTVPQPPER